MNRFHLFVLALTVYFLVCQATGNCKPDKVIPCHQSTDKVFGWIRAVAAKVSGRKVALEHCLYTYCNCAVFTI